MSPPPKKRSRKSEPVPIEKPTTAKKEKIDKRRKSAPSNSEKTSIETSANQAADHSIERLLRLRLKVQKFQQLETKSEKEYGRLIATLNELSVFPFEFEMFKVLGFLQHSMSNV